MKEYVCKDDLQFPGLELRLYNMLVSIPTVKEVDICRKFAEKVKQMMKMPEYGFCDIERIMEIALEEMDEGNDNKRPS